jgi:beta-glucuronidase
MVEQSFCDRLRVAFSILGICSLLAHHTAAQVPIANVAGRNRTSLNGRWQIIVDPTETGRSEWRGYYRNEIPKSDADFKEYAFTDGRTLQVPGDWNSQAERLYYYEGLIWYKKDFSVTKVPGKRYFIHFGAVNNRAVVYVNGVKAGEHEGGFTPFSFEITESIKSGSNFVIVAADNKRSPDGIPASDYDWWDYGGITRDVDLLELPETYIQNYFIQLKKNAPTEIEGWIQINGTKLSQALDLQVPAAKIKLHVTTDPQGYAAFHIVAKVNLWSPENPALYRVSLASETDSVSERIGFRIISVSGTDILLNGKSVFLKGICMHEEIPQQARRAWSVADDEQLLHQAKELGCNFVRLSHYPFNENMLGLADQMGLLVWEEIPLWQRINFSSEAVFKKAKNQLFEMISRDQNRASIIIWSVANETHESPERTTFLKRLVSETREMDHTRLVSVAFFFPKYKDGQVNFTDPLGETLDILGINEYIGWYSPWQTAPEDTKWVSLYAKPLIMTEFGAEALYGNHGDPNVAHSWSEEFQEEFFNKQIRMLNKISFLRGTTPWILSDFKSPTRQLPKYQDEWNRKGLLSDKGQKKKAWFVVEQYYKRK